MAIPLNSILKWFKTSLRPTEAQFKVTFESFRHKLDKVPVAEIEGIDLLIANKADKDALMSHINGDKRHLTPEFIATIRPVIFVEGNPFLLVKHPFNSDPVKRATPQLNDTICEGHVPNEYWVRARCISNIDTNKKESYKALDFYKENNVVSAVRPTRSS